VSIFANVRTRPTITDVAKLCGVTPATVSRVLNGKKKFSASQAVRDKITATAQKLGYVPDLAARNLNRRQTHIVGLFGSPQTHVAEGINESLIEGCAEVLHAGGYDVFFELGAPDRGAPAWRFDGAILLQSPRSDLVADLDRRHVPYVCINERVGNAAANILADDVTGTQRAVEHLRNLGHTRIAYANARATYLAHYSVAERYDTLMSLAKSKHFKVVAGHDTPYTSPAMFLKQAVVEAKATAILAYDHRIAVELLGAAMAMKLRVPQDVSLVCFNDVFPVAQMNPPITTISVSGRDIGRIGAELLLNSLRKPSSNAAKEIRIVEDLIVRGSTAPPKAG
jgi:LacI family transcriptional regulator